MSADELGALRARLVAAADNERRTIERSLHDGVQQDLIAFSVRLQLVRRLAVTDVGAATAMLDELGQDVREALDRLRILANEIYPSVLEARGLTEALRAAASAAGIATRLEHRSPRSPSGECRGRRLLPLPGRTGVRRECEPQEQSVDLDP